MKCFYHNENDAVAVCKNCSKGLCKECVIELKDGVACNAECADVVNRINEMISKGAKVQKITSTAYYRNTFIYGVSGVLIIAMGLDYINRYEEMFPGTLFIILGIVFIIGGFTSYRIGKRFNEKQM